jgi:hypothetical protein
MDKAETERLLNQLCEWAKSLRDIAKTAKKHRKPLTGAGPYAFRFHTSLITLAPIEAKLRPVLRALELNPADLMTAIEDCLEELKETNSKEDKTDSLRNLERLIHSAVLPKLHSIGQATVPKSEQVLPMDVVRGTRGYFVNIVTQANGNYEHGWFDACSVMIRKFVEILIIEVYEKHHKESDIKDANGDFLMLSRLIDKTITDPMWNLNRNTKKGLGPIKDLGDKAAHARRFIATKADVDKVIPSLRDISDEFLHLAGLK